MLVLFVVFCFAPFSSSADDGGAERNVTGTVQAARKAVSSVIGDVEPAPVLVPATMPTFLFGMTAVRRRRMVQRITVQSTIFR